MCSLWSLRKKFLRERKLLPKDFLSLSLFFSCQNVIGCHRAFSLYVAFNGLAEFQIAALKALVQVFGHFYCVWRRGTFHAACNVHRVAPYIVNEFCLSDYASVGGAGVHSDSYRKLNSRLFVVVLQVLHHSDGKVGHDFCVFGIGSGEAAARHVRVADCLDFFNAHVLCPFVKAAEQIVKGEGDFFRRALA